MRKKPKTSMIQSRHLEGGARFRDGEPMRAALSTETTVERVFGAETLIHTDDAIALNRDSLPLTVNHSERDPFSQLLPVGRVDNITLDKDRVMRGDLVFDTDTAGEAARGKVERGMLPDVSITYRVLDYERGDKDTDINVTRWKPLAVSLVTVPADENAGVGRDINSDEVSDVDDKTTPAPASGADDILDDVKTRSQAGYEAGAKAERARLNAIDETTRHLSRAMPHLASQADALAMRCRDDSNISAEQHRAYAFQLLGGAQPLSAEPPPNDTALPGPRGDTDRNTLFAGTQDNTIEQARGMELALLEKCGPQYVTADDMKGNTFRGWTVLDVMEHTLRNHGHDTRGKSREQIAKMAIGMRAITPGTANLTVSSFPALTENIVNKIVFAGFEAAERTWDMWCDTGGVGDFRAFTVPRLSMTTLLPSVAENANYTDLIRLDAKESGQLVKYGGVLSFTWEAALADDTALLQTTAASMGEAAQATVDSNVYAALVANPTMGDAAALFSAGHSNQSTEALALAGIVDHRVKMARQEDENSRKIGPRLTFVIVPPELQDTADDLANSERLVDTGGSTTRENTVRGTFNVVSTPHLTDTNDWYSASRRGTTCRVVFLNGQASPTVEQESAWLTDALHFKVRLPHDVVFVDWRGMVKSTLV